MSSALKPPKKNEEGECFYELSAKRRVTVRKWKGSTLIDIREYWGDAPEKPGKKGISLSLDQWKSLIALAPSISTLAEGKEIKKDDDDDEKDEENGKNGSSYSSDSSSEEDHLSDSNPKQPKSKKRSSSPSIKSPKKTPKLSETD